MQIIILFFQRGMVRAATNSSPLIKEIVDISDKILFICIKAIYTSFNKLMQNYSLMLIYSTKCSHVLLFR